MATGGFSTKNTSIGYYDSAYFDWVITVFMFIAGANFALHYVFLTGKGRRYLQDAEFRFYLFAMLAITLLLAVLLRAETYSSVNTSVRFAAFQVVSIVTTTGYTTADYELWSLAVQFILFALMFFGGCAGSTGGSVKAVRILLLLKHMYREMYSLIHPHAVSPIKLGRTTVASEVVQSVLGFFLLYMSIFIGGTLFMSFLGLDFKSAMSAIAACLGNVGPGLGEVGPAQTYAAIASPGKWMLIFCMILGRLEIFTLFLLFVPEFWRR